MQESARGDVRTLADLALAQLREDIVSGRLPPGSPIRLHTYVDRLQMSAVPIREALRFLEQKGLIERTPHRGVTVADMSVADLEDTYRIRMELESMAIRAAAISMTPQRSKELLTLVDDYAAAVEADSQRARELHGNIHLNLYGLSGSKWLSLLLPMLWDNSERYRRFSLPWRGPAAKVVKEHRQLVQACATGDPDEAERRLRAHLAHSFDAAVTSMRTEEQGGAGGMDSSREFVVATPVASEGVPDASASTSGRKAKRSPRS